MKETINEGAPEQTIKTGERITSLQNLEKFVGKKVSINKIGSDHASEVLEQKVRVVGMLRKYGDDNYSFDYNDGSGGSGLIRITENFLSHQYLRAEEE